MILRQLRESHLLTQTDVASYCSVNVATVSNWERGEQEPRIPQKRKLAELFKVSAQEIQQVIEETMTKN